MKRLFEKSKGRENARISVKHYGGDMILIYRLTSRKPMESEAYIGDGMVFDLSVTKISCRGEKRESICLNDISRREDDALRIFKMVSRGLVTPMSAAEIVSDIIGIYL